MTTRRQFLGAIGAAAALPAALDERMPLHAQAKAPAPAAIVDWHAHWIGPHVIELLEKRGNPRPPAGAGWTDVSRPRRRGRSGGRRMTTSRRS